MRKTIVYVDLDNCSHDQLKGIKEFDKDVVIRIYSNYSQQTKLTSKNMQKTLSGAVCSIEKYIVEDGSNSVDFRIVNDIATEISTNDSLQHIYIISDDGDYDTAIHHWITLHSKKLRAIERVHCIKDCLVDYKLLTAMTYDELKNALGMKFGQHRKDAFFSQIIRVIAYGAKERERQSQECC